MPCPTSRPGTSRQTPAGHAGTLAAHSATEPAGGTRLAGTQVPVLEIGGSHVTSALVAPESWRPARTGLRLVMRPDGSAREILDTIRAAARALAAAPGSPWGVAIPDPFDYQTGTAAYRGVGKFDALRGIRLGEELAPAFRTEPALIRFVNDADAFITGEWITGHARGFRRCAGITLGTGVGSGWLVDGVPVSSGPGVPPGGRAHRLTLDGVPLEDLVSSRSIRSSYAAAAGTMADVREIACRARRGDRLALRVLHQALMALGTAMGPCLTAFGAEVIVVGGSMASCWDLLEPAFLDGAGAAPLAAIRASAGTELSGLVGAAYAACQHSARRPAALTETRQVSGPPGL